MIFSRTPLRLTLGGGGTDLPFFYESHGPGHLISVAINQYIYIAAHDHFEKMYSLKYSNSEQVDVLDKIQHPLFREALREAGIPPGIELASLADIPGGTGLGSSGTFTVGVLNALHAFKGAPLAQRQLAEKACEIEMEKLNAPVGKQDQYAAAFGGLSEFWFHGDGSVEYRRLPMTMLDRIKLEDHLLLFYTGIQRSASEELSATSSPIPSREDEVLRNLVRVNEIGDASATALTQGCLPEFGALMTQQWELKLSRSPSQVHLVVDAWIRTGISAGAAGGKLIGAGGGGFLLFYSERPESVRQAMSAVGLREVRFRFDDLGTTIMPW